MVEKERNPGLFDYFAAAFISNGIAIMWNYGVTAFPILGWLTVPIYIIGAAFSTYLVCRRAHRQYLSVGLKTAIAAIAIGFFMFTSLAASFDAVLMAILVVCYLIGGVAGSYVALNEKLARGKTKTLES